MKRRKPDSHPAKVLTFIILSCVLVALGMLFIFESGTHVWKDKKAIIVESFADIEELQRKHEQYMHDGILPGRSARPAQTAAMSRTHIDEAVEDFMPREALQAFDLPPLDPLPQSLPAVQEAENHTIQEPDHDLLQSIESAAGIEESTAVEPKVAPPNAEAPKKEEEIKEELLVEKETMPLEETEQIIAAPVSTSGKKPKVVIIIDDMGLSLRGRQLEVMSYPLTLAYLPYAENLKERTKIAKQNGHELMVHMPMEPMNKKDGGPRVLEVSDSPEELDATLEWGLSQFEGYVGLNNHMGSKLTQDKEAMDRVMSILKQRNIYFIDSKTIGSSVAAQEAKNHGLAYAERDVFLDHEISRPFIDKALASLEQVARRKGHAIAIGHPHKETIEALKAWLPTLAEKGLELVPASAVVNRSAQDLRVASSAQAEEKSSDAMHAKAKEYNKIEPTAGQIFLPAEAPMVSEEQAMPLLPTGE